MQTVVLIDASGVVCQKSIWGVPGSAMIGIIGYKWDGAVSFRGSVSVLVGISKGEHNVDLLFFFSIPTEFVKFRVHYCKGSSRVKFREGQVVRE